MKVLLVILSLCFDIVMVVLSVNYLVDLVRTGEPRGLGLVALLTPMFVTKEVVHYLLAPDCFQVSPSWYRKGVAAMAWFVTWTYHTVACLVRGHDLEPEIITFKVVEVPKELPPGPPTSAYRRPAEDMEPSLGLVVRRGRRCRRCDSSRVSSRKYP